MILSGNLMYCIFKSVILYNRSSSHIYIIILNNIIILSSLQGDIGDQFYVIYRGSVSVSMTDDSGNEKYLISLGEGEVFGERALIKKEPRKANIIANGPVECYYLESLDFYSMLGEFVEKFNKMNEFRILRTASVFAKLSDYRLKGLMMSNNNNSSSSTSTTTTTTSTASNSSTPTSPKKLQQQQQLILSSQPKLTMHRMFSGQRMVNILYSKNVLLYLLNGLYYCIN